MTFKIKAYFLIGLFFVSIFDIHAQNQVVADSLKILYAKGEFNDDRLKILKRISEEETNLSVKLEFSEVLITEAKEQKAKDYLHSGYLQKGNVYKDLGNNVEALQSYLNSLELAYELNYNEGIGSLLIAIADIYSILNNRKNAYKYYNNGIEILRRSKDSITLASALLNCGDFYFRGREYDKAIENFDESELIFNILDYELGQAYNLGNVGMVYAEQGKHNLAEQNINKAIKILEELEDYYPISVYLTYMADIYAEKDDFNSAFKYANRSLALAKRYGLKDQISEANLKLSELNEQSNNGLQALQYYRDHIAYRDSVKNIETVEQMADLRTDYEVSQKQVEVDLLSQQKKNQQLITIITFVALLSIGVMAFGLFRRNKFIKKTNKIIAYEKERSDNLLLNILPEETAQELKDHGRVAAKKFDSVTVLFTDFKNFTLHAEHLSPEDLVKSVDYYFSKFDEIIEKHGLEKIKTVGDAYMCAAGLPFETDDHAAKMIEAAQDMVRFVEEAKLHNPDNKTRFDIRIGISTGPVVAGVVGSKKFAYDIWGDTVNVASRMESYSDAGEINISEDTFNQVKGIFNCIYRGEIEVKNKGKMKMYFIKSSDKIENQASKTTHKILRK